MATRLMKPTQRSGEGYSTNLLSPPNQRAMLFLIGLGLGGPKDITVRGLEIVKKCSTVYLESYTSILPAVNHEELENFYGRQLIVADREMVEQGEDLLRNAESDDIGLLVVGDPFGATTHTDIVLRAKEKGIKTQVIHNASIINVVGCCGLQLYSFGEIVSIPFWTDSWQPDSFYDKICQNYQRGLHTLCLLDIKVKEPTLESLTKKVRQYLPPSFMSVKTAAKQLLEIASSRGNDCPVNGDTLCVGLARVGSESEQIVFCSLQKMETVDLGPPLHCLAIIGKLHPLESEYIEQFRLKKEEK